MASTRCIAGDGVLQVDQVRTLGVEEDRDGWSIRFPVPLASEQRTLALLAVAAGVGALASLNAFGPGMALVLGAAAALILIVRWTLRLSALRAGAVVSIRSDGIRCAEGFIPANEVRRVRVRRSGSVGVLVIETVDKQVEAARFGVGASGVDLQELDGWLLPLCAELVAPHEARRGHRSEVPAGMVELAGGVKSRPP